MSDPTKTENENTVENTVPAKNGGWLKVGNPGNKGGTGRPRNATLRDIASGVPAAVAALKRKAADGDIRAIEIMLHYDIGKPSDKVEMSGPDGGPLSVLSDLDDDARRELKALALAELERRRAHSTGE